MDIKICGLTEREAIAAAVRHGVSHLGFIFYPPSPRAITPETAAEITAGISEDVKIVAVLVDPSDENISRVITHLSPHILQLHGSETPERVVDIKNKFNTRIMKAIKVSNAEDIQFSKEYDKAVDLVLFDALPPSNNIDALPGGNGIPFNWTLLNSTIHATPWFLSGGINISNVKEAVRITGAKAIDISSGVEDKPGSKSVKKIVKLMEIMKGL
ncbi:MAG: phosphoribosylanthranilate isomerase [Rhodospirillaceae bacterium]|nr:phosphoribosylanthranilate isomerase [Rhodospirillaceae bacterium]|tara:strand:- start:111 stop:752 length:642 start_codon:yes stop_codon:yes gene_type:complete